MKVQTLQDYSISSFRFSSSGVNWRLRRTLLRIALVMLFILVTLEAVLRYAVWTVERSTAVAEMSHRAYPPPGLVRYLNDDGQIATGDLADPGYHVTDDERMTTDQPTTWTRTVWIFGSSTMLGPFVDDTDTIASALQRDLGTRGVMWRVVNVGQGGAAAAIEGYWLTTRRVQRGDLVVFFDGNVDLLFLTSKVYDQWAANTPTCAGRNVLMFLRLWCQTLTAGPLPSTLFSTTAEVVIPRYHAVIDSAKAWTARHGAHFVHIMTPPGYDYPDLYAAMARSDTVTHIDSEFLFDSLHYDGRGSMQVAKQIADVIVGKVF